MLNARYTRRGFVHGQHRLTRKRIHRAERERIENRRRTSQVKTWFRRLENAVGAGDRPKADDELRSLVSRGSTARSSRARCIATTAPQEGARLADHSRLS